MKADFLYKIIINIIIFLSLFLFCPALNADDFHYILHFSSVVGAVATWSNKRAIKLIHSARLLSKQKLSWIKYREKSSKGKNETVASALKLVVLMFFSTSTQRYPLKKKCVKKASCRRNSDAFKIGEKEKKHIFWVDETDDHLDLNLFAFSQIFEFDIFSIVNYIHSHCRRESRSFFFSLTWFLWTKKRAEKSE